MPANKKSDVFTNIFAQPPAKNPSLAVRAAVFFSRSTAAVAVADTIGTVYPMLRLPAHARILSLVVANDAMASMTDMDLGLYVAGDWTDSTVSPDVKEIDIYADGISMANARSSMIGVNAAVLALSDLSMGNFFGAAGGGALTGLQWARQIWEDAGDTVAPRPGTEYDLCWTAKVEPGHVGTIVTGVYYVFGS